MANAKSMPKGVRKGGTRYPRYDLAEALKWARKLVSKTHLGPQPADILMASVVDSKSSVGQVKLSVLKQFNLMDGDSKAHSASALAKAIANSPEDELAPLLSQAALAPPIFKGLYDTFHGDEVTVAKLRQRAADLKVHPEETANCAEMYISSLSTADLVEVAGEKVIHRQAQPVIGGEAHQEEHLETLEGGRDADADADDEGDEAERDDTVTLTDENGEGQPARRVQRAVFNVNISLDSSLDTEKLEKQLKLLKRYGVT